MLPCIYPQHSPHKQGCNTMCRVCMEHREKIPFHLSIGLSDALTQPPNKVFLGQGLSNHTIPKADKQL